MVTFQQLQDAKIESVQTHIDGWIGAAQKVDGLKNTARSQVDGTIRNGSWEGRSGVAASSRTGTLAKELAAAKTEADSVKWLLWLLKRNAKTAQDELKKIVLLVDSDPRLSIRADGTVHIPAGPLGGPDQAAPSILQAIDAKQDAAEYNKQIKKILADVTSIDKQIAAKLKAVANLDAPSDPRFNGNAKADGYIATLPQLRGRFNMPDGHGTPAGESWEGVGTYVKHLEKGPSALLIKGDTEEIAKKRFDPKGLHNGQADATKHTLAAAMTATLFGERNAREITDAHEKLPDNPRNEEVMDLYNNRIGFQIAREHPNASPEELADPVEQKVRSGGTIITDKGATGLWYSDGTPVPR